ncbi:MAG: hydroxymethylglutaryl-CoA synthase family protein [Polyangiaceae bacterium]|jgi:hydroxymethylglutaryl-CoA synthase|nr:hydroxymethylglutaryl-CoA synthase family protein [Polyangiaceae bacterium]
MSSRDLPGVSAMSLYVPPFRVDLKEWCSWTENNWEKISAVVGRSFRVCGRHENVYTMAANAVLRLIRQNDIDPTRVGFLGLGTESSTDNAAGAVIVRGMVDRALESLGLPRLSRYLEVPEFKHACLGGVYALKSALRYVSSDGADRLAIVVSADVAEYERGSTGEQTQGAGAVAMLVERHPKLFGVDLARAGSASDYRGPDFRKPFARHFTEGYAPKTQRLSDFPVFSGKYSTFSYLDETVHAVERMLSRLDVSAGSYYQSVRALFFHRPYHLMPVQAMSFLYVRGLARGDHHHDELRALCQEAGVSFEDVLKETESTPDLYGELLKLKDDAVVDPYLATTAVAGLLRKQKTFRQLLDEKMGLGSETVKDLGNLYSAALPAWIAAGLEAAARQKLDLAEAPLVAVGYGSGDAAEALPLYAVHGYEAAASRIGFSRSLEAAVTLSREQYEALHDGTEVPALGYTLKDEFAIARVGKTYGASFQDLGVEYYDFVQ